METERMRIAVVGCGTAGPAAATLLSRQGHHVTLYERAPECRWVRGASASRTTRSSVPNCWRNGKSPSSISVRVSVLLDQIHDWSQIFTARYGDVSMRRWYGHRIVILGDAAHAMSPQPPAN